MQLKVALALDVVRTSKLLATGADEELATFARFHLYDFVPHNVS